MSPTIPAEEIEKLMKFIAEKAKDVKYPMNIRELSSEFLTETGSALSENGIRTRIFRNRGRIPKMNEFDINAKVKMMFALSASVDAEFLIELKQHAHVVVDDHDRITKYEANDGSLELEGDHSLLSRQKTLWANKKRARVGNDISGKESDEDEDVGGVRKRNRTSNQSATSSSIRSKSRENDRKKRKFAVTEKKAPSEEESFEYEHDQCEENGTARRRSMRARRINTRYLSEPRDANNNRKRSRGRKTARRSIEASNLNIASKNVSVKIVVDEMDDDDEYEYEALNNTMEASILVEQEPSIEENWEVKEEPMEVALVGDGQNQYKETLGPIETNRVPVRQGLVKRGVNVPTVRPGEESSIAVRDMLVALRGPLTAIRSPLIQDTLMNIELKIRELELANKRFPLQKVNIPFSTCLYVLTANAVSDSSPVQYSTSLRDFLICLRAGISHVRHLSMDSFHQELDDLIQEMTVRDKRVRLDTVHRAVSIAFLTISP